MPRTRLRVALACDVPYDSMLPREGGRHCAHCDRTVSNLSALTEREAVALYRARGGDLCGYLVHDARGQPLFAPEPRAPLALGVIIAGALAACEPAAAPSPEDGAVTASLAPPALPALMRPMSTETMPAPPPPPPEREVVAVDEPAITEAPPTAEDRARERRKRAARRAPAVPHAAFAGLMMLIEGAP